VGERIGGQIQPWERELAKFPLEAAAGKKALQKLRKMDKEKLEFGKD